MKRIEELVRSAVGYDQTRGDQVTVVNVRFAGTADAASGTAAGAPPFDFDKNDVMRGVELLILGLVAVLMVFFVLRPMLSSVTGGSGAGIGGAVLAAAGGGVTPLLASAAGGAQPLALAGGGEAALLGPSQVEQRLDLARIEGQVKASSIKKVADFVDKNPEESVSILRSWLHES
jgi:flagellar M-ring protein FliF